MWVKVQNMFFAWCMREFRKWSAFSLFQEFLSSTLLPKRIGPLLLRLEAKPHQKPCHTNQGMKQRHQTPCQNLQRIIQVRFQTKQLPSTTNGSWKVRNDIYHNRRIIEHVFHLFWLPWDFKPCLFCFDYKTQFFGTFRFLRSHNLLLEPYYPY